MKSHFIRNSMAAMAIALAGGAQAQNFVEGDHAIFDPFLFDSLGAGSFSSVTLTFNDSGGTPQLTDGVTPISGEYQAFGGRDYAIFTFDSINFSSVVVSKGTATTGLVLLSRGGVSLSGTTTITLNGAAGSTASPGAGIQLGAAGGPGGFAGGNGVSSTSNGTQTATDGSDPGNTTGGGGGSTSRPSGSANVYASGGGGGNGGAGGAGLTSLSGGAGTPTAGVSGTAYATAVAEFQSSEATSLAGGSGGGGGSRIGSSPRGYGGGGGGGSLQIVAGNGNISVSNSVTLNVSGGNGGGNIGTNGTVGGGGGAGGTVVLAATGLLVSDGLLTINTDGGNGGNVNSPNVDGGRGGGGRIGVFAGNFTTDTFLEDSNGDYTATGFSFTASTPGGSVGNAGLPGTIFSGGAIITAIPEPSTVAVAVGLLAGAVAIRRRRKA